MTTRRPASAATPSSATCLASLAGISKWNFEPTPSSLATPIVPPIDVTIRLEMARPEAGAAMLARRRAVGLLEFLEDAIEIAGRDARAGVGDA